MVKEKVAFHIVSASVVDVVSETSTGRTFMPWRNLCQPSTTIFSSLGIMIDGFPAAVIAFSLNFAAYNSEVLRSAIQAVPVGQTEAAYMVGLNYFQLMTRIVLPQAARIAFPPLFNSLIGLVKDTSLAATITVIDMLAVSKQIAARYYEPMPMYVETAIIYLVICTVLTKVQSYLEKKLEWKQPEDVGEEKPALSDTAKLE